MPIRLSGWPCRASWALLLSVPSGSVFLASAQAQPADAGTDAAAGSDRLANENIVRKAPQLTRKPDGGYRFAGNGFDATIDADGTVHMRDKFVSARPRLRSFPINQNDWVVSFWEVKFDLFAWLESKRGNDPYRSERRWFLAGTHDLRQQLATRAAVESMRNALQAIWSRAGLDFAERKRRTFALWDESAEDDFGNVGRAQILEFVRERCPRESVMGFGDDELRTLNATRRSRAVFAPYVSVPSPPRAGGA